MAAAIPKDKLARGLLGGMTAARVGGEALKYLVRKPFQSGPERAQAINGLNRDIGALLFNGASVLKGAALKLAQFLCLEDDLLPEEITRELGKACGQVPPINRALARKIVSVALGGPPEEVFAAFDANAFAAASLGQVHRATARDGAELAVKIQYPGIRETIHGDIRLAGLALRPLASREALAPALAEVEEKLLEETDYRRELDNIALFKERLRVDGVVVPTPRPDLSAETVLSCERIDGLPLNAWLATGPEREMRDRVAQILQDVFCFGLYRMHCIHADPNPGNFIVRAGGSVGLVDFGCVKRFDPGFVGLYATLPELALHGNGDDYLGLMDALRIAGPGTPKPDKVRMAAILRQTGQWLAQLYQEETFDFAANPEFIAEGKRIMLQAYDLRRHMDVNTNFIFLHRTRYGLLRLYERMRARVRFRNPHENGTAPHAPAG